MAKMHGKDVSTADMSPAEIESYHQNLHKYGGSPYDNSPGGVLTHDHAGLPTRAQRGMPNEGR